MADGNWLTGPFCKTQHYYQGAFSVGDGLQSIKGLKKSDEGFGKVKPESEGFVHTKGSKKSNPNPKDSYIRRV